MALNYIYADAYLKTQVTEDREVRATDEVNAVATFAADWLERLVILRTYIITCLECQAQPDDLFAQKLKHYRQEYDSVLSQAKSDTLDADLNPLPSMSVSLERN